MKDLSNAIVRLRSDASALRDEILAAITEFVSRHGAKYKDGHISLTIDPDVHDYGLDPVWLPAETDRDTGTLERQEMDAIHLDGKNLSFETTDAILAANQADIFDLIEIYEYLDYAANDENLEIGIENGCLVIKDC